MNINLLKAKIIENGYNMSSFSEKIAMNKATFCKKLRGKSEFNRAEIEKISDTLLLTGEQIRDIFFTKQVS